MDIAEEIRKARPNIKDSSIKSYVLIIKKIANKMGVKEIENFDFLTKMKKVLKALPENANTKKTYVASIVVALDTSPEKYEDELENYRAYMDILIEQYNENQKLQKKNKKQNDNWVSFEKLNKYAKSKFNNVKRNLNRKQNYTKYDKVEIQDALILNLYISQDTAPRRLEYADCRLINSNDYKKLSNAEEEDNNWCVIPKGRRKKVFVFNKYKTFKTYGSQKIPCNKIVSYLINLLLKINPDRQWLLLNINTGTKMSKNYLTKTISKLLKREFNKQLSISMIRHIYISDLLKDMPRYIELDKIAKEMGHNVYTQALYRKT